MSPPTIVLLLHKSHKALHFEFHANFLISGERETDKKRFHKALLIYLHSSLSQVSILSFFSFVFFVPMRAEDSNTLDLNNFPDDPSRDLFPFFEEGSSSSSSSGVFREKQGKDGKEYECRFCSLKFFKSQALGGHMNRHRQERETESLNKARELVLRNDSFPPHQGPPSFSYHQGDVHIGDLITPFKPMMYPPRLFSISTSSSALLSPPPPLQPPLVQPYLYPPPPSPFPHHHTSDYYQGSNNGPGHQPIANSVCGGRAPPNSSYTFIGTPVSNGSRVAPLPRPLPPHHGL